MEKTRQILTDNEDDYPHFAKYYIPTIIDTIEENINAKPDIAIESCKSLVEGVSKTLLDYFKIPYKESGRDADAPRDLFKKVLTRMVKDTEIDDAFLQVGANLVIRITEIRNERGDISHGRAAPKLVASDTHLAEAIAQTTDGLLYYLLKLFFTTDWSYLEEVKYEKNEEFNQYLDEGTELDGVIYSKALFDQDPIAYRQQLENYQDQN